jgi:hypothetical protein
MLRFSRLLAAPLFLVLVALVGCTRDPAPVSPVTGAAVATSAAGHESVVVRTDDIDQNADGVTDVLKTETDRYDVHGNIIVQTVETSRFGMLIDRSTATNEYNNHNDLTGYVYDVDGNGDGFVDERHRLTTVATDQEGHPLRYALSVDLHVDGSIDFSTEYTNEFDARGRLIAQAGAQQTDAYQYDQHDNVARHEMHWAQGTRTVDLLYNGVYSVHDVEVSSTSSVAQSRQQPQAAALTSVSFDTQGYPTLQDLVFKSGNQVTDHVTIAIEYDGHHRIVSRVASEDRNGDGAPDVITTSRYDYTGPDLANAHGWIGARADDFRGAAQLVAEAGKGPDSPSGGHFTR